MKETSRWIAAAVGVLGVFCASEPAWAQLVASSVRVAALASGTIRGQVQDEAGLPVAGVLVSALGSATAVDVTDRTGRFELRSLPPGPYLVRARLSGFIAPRGQVVQVLPSGNALSPIALRHVSSSSIVSPPLVPASVGPVASPEAPAQPEAAPAPAADGHESGIDGDELAWRLRHARRSILNDVQQVLVAAAASGPSGLGPTHGFGRAMESSARLATNFFVGTPFSGQLNLLTTSSFDAVQDMFAPRAFAGRSVANFIVGAPAGVNADWTVRGAVTQGDLSSWVVSGDYVTRAAAARHRYDLGLAYSTQRYDGGNIAALRNVTDGSRNVGTLHGFDTFTVSRAVIVTYGADYARYDYLSGSSLLSPARRGHYHTGRTSADQRPLVAPRGGAGRRRICSSRHGHLAAAAADVLFAGRPEPAHRGADDARRCGCRARPRAHDDFSACIPPARRRSARHAFRRRPAGSAECRARPLLRGKQRRSRCHWIQRGYQGRHCLTRPRVGRVLVCASELESPPTT